MEHIEEAGIHSGDSACVLPPHSLPYKTVREIEKQTGLDFFWELPDEIENALETSPADARWNWELPLNPNKYSDS